MIQPWVRLMARLGGGLLVAGLLAFGGNAVSAAEPIKIGSFLAVTGPASFLGDPEKKTLELYAEKINKEGGVLGRQLQLVIYDTGGDAKQAATFARRLIEEDKVDFLIGGSTTGDTMAAVPLVERVGIPFISMGGASVIVEPVKKWVFKTPHPDRVAVEKVYADMKKNGLAKVGLIAGNGGFDKSCMANASDPKLLAQYGLTIVASETYSEGDKDMTPQLTKIKNAPGLQAVLFCGFGAASVIVTKNYRQLGIKAQLYHNHGSGSKQFIEGAGDAANGVKLPAAALLVAAQLPDSDPQKAPGLAYTKAYTERYHEPIATFGGHAYDALTILVNAIKRAGSTDRAKVRDAIESTKNYIGVDGIYNMTPQDHCGLDLASLKMIEVENGNWKYLY
ncbi:MAG TPA: ABC transporter substrate-binding protein [Alphaproteobacteria bacterium]|nr:ABC transporter substrate-binding protein [Alphaproteobacteria bacterium]